MIRCITFDLDDTLWAVDPVIQQANQTMFAWLKQHAPEFLRFYQLQDLGNLRAKVIEIQPDIAHSVTRIRMAQLTYGLQQAGYSSALSEALAKQAFEVFLHARQQVEFFEHAREMLVGLKHQGYQLGALTNGNADIHRVGLSDLIDFQFTADDVGEMKPHPKMFQQMLRHCRLRPEQVVHVGDHLQHDVEGAASAGLWTIWVNVKKASAESIPTKEVRCLSEVGAKVAEIEQLAAKQVTL